MGKIRKTFIAKTFMVTTVALLAAASFGTAASATTFDGEWSVHIASSNSTCGNGQTVSIGINNGQVSSSMVQASCHVAEAGGSILVVSQFTLYGDYQKGRRPSFIDAAPPEHAIPLYECFINALRAHGLPVQTGRFGAMMQVELVNDGPVTVMVESK